MKLDVERFLDGFYNILFTKTHIAPAEDNTYDIGASGFRYRDIHLAGQLHADAPQGTAPFVVTSTTPVANLHCAGVGTLDPSDWLSPTYITVSHDANLLAERTLAVGNGLVMVDGGPNASVTLDLADSVAGNGLQIASKVLSVKPATLISVSSAGVALANSTAKYDIILTGASPFTPAYTHLSGLPSDATVASTDWVSQSTGWGIYQLSDGRSGGADFRFLYTDELHAKAFIADLEQALAGGQIISKSVAILATAFTIPAKGSSASMVVEDLPGTTAYVFATGDYVRVRNISRSGSGLSIADAYGTVTQVSQNGNGTQTYTFSRPAGDTGTAAANTVVQKGGLVLDYGISGNGYWEVTTLDAAGSPYAQVATWATQPSNLTVHTRLGNLDGISGIGAEWGLWAGKDSTHYLLLSDQSAQLRGIKQEWIDASGNVRATVDPSAAAADYLFWLGPSSGDKRFAVTGDGTVYIGSVPSSNIAGWAYSGDVTKIDGGNIYAGSVTAEKVTVTGYNMLPNPGFENGFSNWTNFTAYLHPGTKKAGAYSAYAEGTGAVHTALQSPLMPVVGGEVYYISFWAFTYLTSGTAQVWYNWIANDKVTNVGYASINGKPGGTWTKYGAMVTAPSNAGYLYLNLATGADIAPGGYAYWDELCVRQVTDVRLLVGTPGSARIEINSSGIEGYSDATTKQFYLRTSDGKAAAGGVDGSGNPNVLIDGSGIKVNVPSSLDYGYVNFVTGANTIGKVRMSSGGSPVNNVLYLASENYGSGQVASAIVRARHDGANFAELRVDANTDANLWRWLFQGALGGTSYTWMSLELPTASPTPKLWLQQLGVLQVDGKVGIKTSPAYPLDVNGTGIVRGNFYVYNRRGYDGGTCDADGNWHNIVSGLNGHQQFEVWADFAMSGIHSVGYWVAGNTFGGTYINGNSTNHNGQGQIQLQWVGTWDSMALQIRFSTAHAGNTIYYRWNYLI